MFQGDNPTLIVLSVVKLVGWLCLTSHRQRGHLETAPPFTVLGEGREASFTPSLPGIEPRVVACVALRPLHNRCATPAPFFVSM